MLVELSLIFVLIIFLYCHFTKYNNYWKEKNVAGPKPSFFFGNIKDVALRKRHTAEVYKEIYDKYPNEKFLGIFRMRSPDLLVKDLEIIKHILIKDFEYFTDREVDFVKENLGANLFAANGETWKALRQRLTPIFTTGKLKNMLYLINERGDKLVNYIDKITRNQQCHEMHGILRKYSQANITACAFGLDVDTFDNPTDTLEKLEPKIFTHTYKSEIEMIYPGLVKYLKLGFFPSEVNDFFRSLSRDVIAKRNGEPCNRHDFIDLMLGLRKANQTSAANKEFPEDTKTINMTDDIIAGQMFIFYIAGYQTSALTMSFMLYYLALYPDIQEKVIAEIEEVLQKHDGKLTYEAVVDLKYMGQVFDETLRLHPIGDSLRRRCVRDYKIPGTHLTVEKGQVFIIPIPVVHMDENNYADPKKFDPERFSPENVALRHSCAYLPFGLGPRHCIGIRFAQIQSRVGMAKLLSKFRVEPSAETPRKIQYEARFILHPRGGIPLKLVRRI